MHYVHVPCCMDVLADNDLALKNYVTALHISKLHCVSRLPQKYTILSIANLPYKSKHRSIGSSSHAYC